LAFDRNSVVTSAPGTPKTRAAVAVWMSSPASKAAISPGSSARCDAAQLDLVVVGDQQRRAGRGDEDLAEGPPGLGADRDVVQVRRVRGEPAGAGHRLVEGGVDAPGGGVHLGQQPFPVGGAELLHLPVGEQVLDHGVLAAQALERGGIGGVAGLGLLLRRQPQPVEQHLPELLRRVDVELLAGVGDNLVAQALGIGFELAPQSVQPGDVHTDTAVLHPRQHPHQRHLDRVVQHLGAAVAQFGAKGFRQAGGGQGLERGTGPQRLAGLGERQPSLRHGLGLAGGQGTSGVARQEIADGVVRL